MSVVSIDLRSVALWMARQTLVAGVMEDDDLPLAAVCGRWRVASLRY